MSKLLPTSLLLRIFLILFPSTLTAQIVVNGTQSVPSLVNNVLVGTGVSVSNISPSGVNGSIGFFNGTASNIGLDSGIVMATGGLGNVPYNGFGNNQTGMCTDPDLAIALNQMGMGGFSTYNCVIIEFDFVPTTDSVKFQYIFASDEYPGFTCSNFNDVFGFFISGPGITGPYSNNGKNLALIPGTNIPVAINTVNSGVPSGGSPAPCLSANPNFVAHSIYFVNNTQTTVGYPGFTVPLTAQTQVQCGQTYHIKLAIADVSDGSLNSAVFLKANSFTGGQVQISSVINFGGNDSTLYETCGDANILFTRFGNLNQYDTVSLVMSGTATNGVDYSTIPDSIIFAPGQSTYTLNILAYADAIAEGLENLIITATVNNPCLSNQPSTFELDISDLPPVYVTASADTSICLGDSVQISATGSGGMNNDPLIYTWSNSYSGTSQYVQPNGTTAYIVTATDSCGIMTATDTVIITVMPPIIPVASQDEAICIGDSIQLFASGSNFYNWTPSTGLSNSSISDPWANPTTTTTYVVEVSDGVCSQFDSTTIIVNPLPVITLTADTTICLSNSIPLTALGGVTYTWSPNNGLSSTSGSTVTANPTVTSTYSVTVTDANGCTDTADMTLTVNPPLYIQAAEDTTLCAEQFTDTLWAYGTGGNGGPYTYTWNPPHFLDTTGGPFVISNPATTTTYTVTLTDNCGTPAVTDTVVVNVNPLPMVQASASDLENCAPLYVNLSNMTPNTVSCHWEFGDGTFSNDCNTSHTYSNAGTYSTSLAVVDSNGCRDTLTGLSFEVWPNPHAEFETSPGLKVTMLNPEVFFSDESYQNIVSWHWDVAGQTQHTTTDFSHIFQMPGNYPVTLTVVNQYGCVDEITYTIVVDPEFVLYLPNAFSPNGDGMNDIFKAEAVNVSNFHMEIYNRWGEKLFETNDINQGWDGTYRGIRAEMGVYVYKLTARGGYEASSIAREGVITLVR